MATVLIADDDARIRLLLRSILRGEGHAVIEAADGDAGLAAVRAHRPAVAILDVQMPGPSGLEVCRAIRAAPDLAGTAVVIASADAAEAHAAAAGAAAFLAKPFSVQRLLATVGDLAAGHAAPSEPTPLRELRAERLLSIRDLARLADVAPSTVSLIETGRAAPQPSTIRAIAAALRIDPLQVAEFRQANAAYARPR